MKRRMTSSLLAAGMLMSSFAGLSVTANAAVADGKLAVGDTVKFDFGAEGQTVTDGFYSVTPSTEYNTTTAADGLQYGLFGQNENDYKLGNYEDGVTVKKGQVVTYSGGTNGECLGIGELGSSQIAGVYPIRFAMAAENNSYYEVQVNVTTLDSSKDATGVFVYSERRHPIVTNQTIAAGETQTVTFRATVQSVLLKDRANGGDITYRDDKLNVSVMGDNAAISSIEVTKIDPSTTKTIWCYNDSTGCDYPMALPYFPLQNYGGTAQYLSKYLPDNIALVNQGDGGLASGASSYFNVCKNNFKAGDYVYLQYGHNESSTAGYLKNLPAYYKFAHSKGATMVYAGPIDRHNATQYNASTNTWSSTLSGYSNTAKKYTEILICAGPDAGDTFVTKAQSSWDDANAYYNEIIAAGITAAGVTDVAFVDLNAPTLTWLRQVCDEVKTIKGASDYNAKYSDYYFRSQKGTTVDGTHENDYGADATASFFFDGIKAKETAAAGSIEAVEYAALSPLITNMRAAYGSWDHVTADVINAGSAPNSAWPEVFQSADVAAYPTAVKSVAWNDNGTIASVSIVKQESTMAMDDYGMLKLEIYDKDNNLKGTIGSSQVDNTWSDGTTTVYYPADGDNRLTGDTTAVYDKAAGDTYTATIYRASKGDGSVLNYIEPLQAYSDVYVPTDYEGALITNEDGNSGEDFNFYGAKYDGTASAADKNGWKLNGSASKSATLKKDGDRCYITATTENSGSMNFCKGFASSPAVNSNGRLKMSVDLRNATEKMQFTLASNYKANWPDGQTLTVFTLSGGKVYANGKTLAGDVSGSAWQTVTADIDLDRGTITVKVGNGTAVTANVSGLQKNFEPTPNSLGGICIAKNGNNAGSVDIAELSVDKYTSDDALPVKTLTFAKSGNGTVQVNGAAAESVAVKQSQPVTLKAVPADFYTFTNWTDADGNVLSTEANYTYPRVYEDATITANFTSTYGEGYTAAYIDGFTENFEGTNNIFGESNDNIFDTTTIDSKSIYGNVLKIPNDDASVRTASLSNTIALEERQFVEFSHNTFFTYAPNKGVARFAVLDGTGKELVSYEYNNNSTTNITSLNIGGTTPEGFESFGFNSATMWTTTDAVRYPQFNYTSANGSHAAGNVKIRIDADKSVVVTFTKESTVKTYTGTLTDDVTIKSIIVTGGSKNGGREYGFDNFTANLVTAPVAKHSYTVNAVDKNNTVISTIATGSIEENSKVTVPAIHEVIKIGDDYYQLNDADLNGYSKTFAMGTEDIIESVKYEKNNNIVFYREGEADNGTDAAYSGGGIGVVAAQNARDRGISVGTLPAGSYNFIVNMAKNQGRGLVLRQGKNDPFASITTDKNDAATKGLKSVSFELAEATSNIFCNGANSGTTKTNQSEDFDYVIIEKVEPEPTPEPKLQDEVEETGNTTIKGEYDGENAEIPANATVTIADGASIKNGTLSAKDNGTITVKVGNSTISNASSVQFDSAGKITPSDGAVISTPNGTDGETDKGFFIMKSFESAANKTTFKINDKEYTANFATISNTNVLFGIFVTGIPEGKTVTVTAE